MAKSTGMKSKPAKGSDGRFLPGNSGGAGRPVGSRNRLSEAFVEALAVDFDEHGTEVIERVRTEDPAVYLRTVASLVPRRLEMETASPVESLSDAQLEALIRSTADEAGIPIPPPCRSKASH